MPDPKSPKSSAEEAAQQRDQALACAWLAFVISLALLCSNLRDHSRDDLDLRQRIDSHRQLMAEVGRVRDDNDKVLRRTEAAATEMRKALISPAR